jgi:RNA polymerase sigma-70 factor (ECF subfamily)
MMARGMARRRDTEALEDAAATTAPEPRVAQPSEQRLEQRDVEDGLARRAAAGDMGAFDALVAVFGARVLSVATRMLGDRAEAEDVTQEVFVAVYDGLASFRGEARVSTWIFRIARNRCLNRIELLGRRGRGKHVELDDPAALSGTVDLDTVHGAARDPRRGLENAELRALLEQHLRRLPEEQRLLVVLRDLEDLSYEEIVDVTGLPLGTVKSRLHRARAELARALGPVLDAREEAP